MVKILSHRSSTYYFQLIIKQYTWLQFFKANVTSSIFSFVIRSTKTNGTNFFYLCKKTQYQLFIHVIICLSFKFIISYARRVFKQHKKQFRLCICRHTFSVLFARYIGLHASRHHVFIRIYMIYERFIVRYFFANSWFNLEKGIYMLILMKIIHNVYFQVSLNLILSCLKS